MNRGAFTLIEVLVAVFIISILVTSVLKIVSRDDGLIRHAKKIEEVASEVSLFADTLTVKKDKKKIDLYDYVKNLKLRDSDKIDYKIVFDYSCDVYKSFDEDLRPIGQTDDEQEKDKTSPMFSVYKENFKSQKGGFVSFFRIRRD